MKLKRNLDLKQKKRKREAEEEEQRLLIETKKREVEEAERKAKEEQDKKHLPLARSISKWVPISDDLDPTEKSRNLVINEIINSEIDYVNDLDYINEAYIKYIHNHKILDESQSSRLFVHLSFIINMNKELLDDLKEKVQNAHAPVGSSFLKMSAFLKGYSSYCADQDEINNLIEEFKKNSNFKKITGRKKERK